MSQNSQILSIRVYNGRTKTLDVEKMIKFDQESVFGRYYRSRPLDTSNMFEQFGDWVVDYTNVHSWAEEIPDVDPRSARLFTLWAEDSQTGTLLGLIRGFFVLVPFTLDKSTLHDYYSLDEGIPYYPMAIISSFRTIVTEEKQMDELLEKMREGISLNWKEVRESIIKRLSKSSKLWKRYILSFPDVIHFTFICPSFDREIIDALNRKDYRITGVMQILSSPSPLYDEATIRHHLRSAQEIIDDYP